jgi:hypothetical protein
LSPPSIGKLYCVSAANSHDSLAVFSSAG